ncbi:hypothetical protein Bca4012_060815 [Brassica carinata]
MEEQWIEKKFPNVSDRIVELGLAGTEIEEIPPWMEKLFPLRKLNMHGCKKLGKQNGLTLQYGSNQLHHIPARLEHLYIFEDCFSLNQDCPEAGEAILSELSFLFRVHDKTWKVKGCGVQLLRDEENACGGDESVDDGDNADVEDDIDI